MAKHKKSSYVPAGVCEVRVIGATSYIANGNEMVGLKLSVYGGRARTLDLLVFRPQGMRKITAFLTAIQVKVADGEAIRLGDFIGRSGRARVKVVVINHRFYNMIVKWLPPKDASRQRALSNEKGGDLDGDLP